MPTLPQGRGQRALNAGECPLHAGLVTCPRLGTVDRCSRSTARLRSSCRRRGIGGGSAPRRISSGHLLRIRAVTCLLMRRTQRFGRTASTGPTDDHSHTPDDRGIGDLHRDALGSAGLGHPRGHLAGAARGHRLVTPSGKARVAGTPNHARRCATTVRRRARRPAGTRPCPCSLGNPTGTPQTVGKRGVVSTMEPIEPGRGKRLRRGYGQLYEGRGPQA